MAVVTGDGSERVVQVALAVIVDDSLRQVVVGTRADEQHLGGYLEFPGGKLDRGESADACAVREALEETGLNVVVLKSMTPVEHAYADRHVRLLPFICGSVGETAHPKGLCEPRWMYIADLRPDKFPPANEPIIAELNAFAGLVKR